MKFRSLYIGVFVGAMALAGCKSPPSESLDVAAYRQSNPIRLEFVRPCRIYESGDAVFAMVNDTRELLWFMGQGPELPVARLKLSTSAAEQDAVGAGQGAKPIQRFPLAPRETRYFEIKTGKAAGTVQVGMTFYNSFSTTNGKTVWSRPVAMPFK